MIFHDIDAKLFSAFDIYLFAVFILIAFIISIMGSLRLHYNLKPFYSGITLGTSHRVNVYSMLSGLWFAGIIGSTITKVSLPAASRVNKHLLVIVSLFEKAVILVILFGIALISFLFLKGVDIFSSITMGNTFDFIVVFSLLPILIWLLLSRFVSELLRVLSGLFLSTTFYSLLIVLLNALPMFLILNNLLDISVAEKILYTAALMFIGSLPISFQGIGVREAAAVYILSQYNLDTSLLLGNILMVSFASIVVISIMPLTIHFFGAQDQKLIEKKETVLHDALQYLEDHLQLIAIPCIIFCIFELRVMISTAQIPATPGDFIAIILLFGLVASFLNKTIAPRLKHASLILSGILIYFLCSFGYGWITGGISLWALNSRVIGGLFLLGYMQAGYCFFDLDKKQLQKVFLIFLCLMGIYISAFLSFITFPDLMGNLCDDIRFSGPGIHPDTTAFYLSFLMIFFIMSYYKDIISLRFLKLAGLVIPFCIGLTHSLCGLVVVAAIGFIWLLYDRKKMAGLFACILISILLSVFVVAFSIIDVEMKRAGGVQDSESSEIIGKIVCQEIFPDLDNWKESLQSSFQLFNENWLIGAGLGQTLNKIAHDNRFPPLRYNSFTLYLADTGISGVLLIGYFFYWLYTQVRKSDKGSQFLRLCFWSAILIVAFFSLLHDISFQRFLWIWIGAFLFLVEKHQSQKQTEQPMM